MATSKLPPRLALLLPLLLLLPSKAEGSAGVVTSFKVASRIEHRYAITQVVTGMANPNPIHADVRFKMALPKAAFISAFTIEVGGVNYTSAVGDQLPPFTGRHTERRERSAWLVRQARDSLQLLEVSAGVAGYGKVTFHLTYEELLRRVDGRYTYEVQVRPGQVVREVEVLVHVLDREAIQDYKIHQLPGQHLNSPRPGATVSEKMRRPGEVQVRYVYTSKDLPSPDAPSQAALGADGTFTLSYKLRTRRDGGEIQRENHHFVHTFCPEGLARMSTHTVLVLDVSLSMKGDQFNHMKDAVHAMLEELQPRDTFEVLVFSTDVKSLGVFNGTRNHRRKVRRMLKRLRPLGNSNLSPAYHTALRRAVHHLEKNVARKVVMVSDGHGTKGQTDPAAIRASLAATNTRHIPIFGVVLQPDADVRLIEQVSEDSRGKTLKVYPHDADLKTQVKEFFKQVSSPLLTEVKMEYPQGQVMEDFLVADHNSDYFYSGREMVTAGVLTADTKTFHPAVTARGRNGLLRLHVDRVDSRYMTGPPGVKGESGVVTRIWAYLMVQDLLARMAASDDPQVIVRLHYTLQDLATRHRFVTEFTALLVVLPNHGYELVYPQQERPRYKKDFHPGHGPANQSFVVGDPNFVVHTPGVTLPFCFSYHGHHGAFLSLIQDPVTGIMVNGQVTSTSHEPSQTYFSRLFFALGRINVTVTLDNIHIDCLDEDRTPLVSHVERSLYPFYDKRGRPYRKKNRRRENETAAGKKGAKGLRRKGNNLSRQCNQRTAWQKGMARMYGSAMILQKQGTSQLDVILGDGEAHFGVTRTSGSDGQRYLGFYVEGQNMLSPHAQGIIGQFNNKTVELLPSEARRCGDTDTSTLLRVQRRGPQGLVETTQLCGQRGLHQSTMSNTQVDCIDVGDEGLGLLDRTSYDLPCLACAVIAS